MKKKTSDIHLIIHGHFYQPPRENPWLGAIEAQEGARPYHDWNERILAECYRPNTRSRILDPFGRVRDIVNNLERISFNFGPTLASYIEASAPDVYARILDADRRSAGVRSGHGNAVAQAYHHAILPLLPREDREILIRWGLADFERRFGRKSEGLWLPETGVNDETAADLARAGVRFVLLSPYQAWRTRPLAGGAWRDVADGSIDPRRAYRLFPDPENRDLSLDVLFYHSGLSAGISFEHYLYSADSLGDRLLEAAGGPTGGPRLVLVATDGEVYGHHEPFGDMCLAALFGLTIDRLGLHATNPGEFLDQAEPEYEVALKPGPGGEGTAWSCAHGLGRWSRDCGCRVAHRKGWTQEWRAPLREALLHLRGDLLALFDEEGARHFRDPRGALGAYIEVLGQRSPEAWRRFLEREGKDPLPWPAERAERAYRALEMAHGALRMFTSCGWFFDDLAGVETVQNLLFAAHAIELARAFDPERAGRADGGFRRLLRRARSNVPEEGDGRSVLDDRFEKSIVKPRSWAASWVGARLAGVPFPPRLLAGRDVSVEGESRARSGALETLTGLLRVRGPLGIREERLRFVAARGGGPRLLVWVGDESLRTDCVLGASDLEGAESAMSAPPLRMRDLNAELRGFLVEGLLEAERDALLEALDAGERRAETIAGLLESARVPAPAWARRALPALLEPRIRSAASRLSDSIERSENPAPHLRALADVRALAGRLGADPGELFDERRIVAALREKLRGRREGDAEGRAGVVLAAVEGLAESGFPLREIGSLQDELFDQRKEGMEAGPRARALAERLGFAPEVFGPPEAGPEDRG